MGCLQSYKLKNRSKLAISIAAAVGMAAGFGNGAVAQEDATIEEVVVTGSALFAVTLNPTVRSGPSMLPSSKSRAVLTSSPI